MHGQDLAHATMGVAQVQFEGGRVSRKNEIVPHVKCHDEPFITLSASSPVNRDDMLDESGSISFFCFRVNQSSRNTCDEEKSASNSQLDAIQCYQLRTNLLTHALSSPTSGIRARKREVAASIDGRKDSPSCSCKDRSR